MKSQIFFGVLFLLWQCCCCLVLDGTWLSEKKFFHFVTKFGFQKTIPQEGELSEGFIYGNITSSSNLPTSAININGGSLVLLPKQFFVNFYGNATYKNLSDLNKLCELMFDDLWQEAYDARCHDTGREDFLRSIPCPSDGICPDEDNPGNLIPGSQLTYAIKDINNPRFWYLSLVACHLNSTCGWEYSGPGIDIRYHLTLVNGRPPAAKHGFFSYHFSAEHQEVGVLILFCLFVYCCVLLPVQVYATFKQRLRPLEVLTAVMLLQTIGLAFAAAAEITLGGSGRWFPGLWTVAELCTLLSEAVLLLLLLLLARGWAVTPSTGHHTPVLYSFWGLYTGTVLALYISYKVLTPAVLSPYHYSWWPGISGLALRGVVTIWYLCELRGTMLIEQRQPILQFLLQLGASTLVWLVYLPVVALIAVQVSPLWRHKLLLGFRYSADLLAHLFMTYTLYPRRSHPYLILATPSDHLEDLEVLDQAPHVLHRKSSRRPHFNHYNINNNRSLRTIEGMRLADNLLSSRFQYPRPKNSMSHPSRGFVNQENDSNILLDDQTDEEQVEFSRQSSDNCRTNSRVDTGPAKYKVTVTWPSDETNSCDVDENLLQIGNKSLHYTSRNITANEELVESSSNGALNSKVTNNTSDFISEEATAQNSGSKSSYSSRPLPPALIDLTWEQVHPYGDASLHRNVIGGQVGTSTQPQAESGDLVSDLTRSQALLGALVSDDSDSDGWASLEYERLEKNSRLRHHNL